MKKILKTIVVIALILAGAVALTACDKTKDSYNKTYVATAESCSCENPLAAHKSIYIHDKVGKPYIQIADHKAKLVSTEEETMTFGGKDITVIRMNFKAEWKTTDLGTGKWTERSETETYYYVPDGDYFIVGNCKLVPAK